MDIIFSIWKCTLVHITFFITSKMSGFQPTKSHMLEALLFCFYLKTSASWYTIPSWSRVFGGIKKVWYTTSCWNRVKRLKLFAINKSLKLNQGWKKKRPEYAKRHEKLILLHDNARPHVTESVNIYIYRTWIGKSYLTGHSARWLSFVSSHSEWFVITAFQVLKISKNGSMNASLQKARISTSV